MSNMSMAKTQVLIFSDFFLPGFKGGGPIKTLSNLIEATASDELSFRVVTRDRDLGDTKSYPNIVVNRWNNTKLGSVFYASPSISNYIKLLFRLRKSADGVVYFNSFFSPFYTIIPLLFFLLSNKKIIVAPKGEFSGGALAIKPSRKKLFINFCKVIGINRSVLFHASTLTEQADIKRVFGEFANVYIAEDISLFKSVKTDSLPDKNEIFKIIFLSRIASIKNLKFALEILHGETGIVEFDIYGPIEDKGYWAECMRMIENMPDNVRVKYRGEVEPDNVPSTIAAYHLFFLPTRGENFGHVIAESLSAGTPVLISDQTPWKGLSDLGVGWDIPLEDRFAYSKAIQAIVKMPSDVYLQMRTRARLWAQEKLMDKDLVHKNKHLFKYDDNRN